MIFLGFIVGASIGSLPFIYGWPRDRRLQVILVANVLLSGLLVAALVFAAGAWS